jgi:hypothetical protein
MKTEIILENNEFKVVSVEDYDTSLNIAIRYPSNNSESISNMANGVDVLLINPYDFNAPIRAKFLYKNVSLEERKVGSKVTFCEVLNHYNKHDEDQLNKKLIEVQQGIKSELEIEIEKLNETKKKLIETNEKLKNLFEGFNKEVSIIIDDCK